MSVLGLSIDYGPFGFLDAFDPRYTPNTTDLPWRRYCFANQPDIGLWNIGQFTATLSAAQLINNDEANYAMERYANKFMDEYQSIMTRKLGLSKYNQQLISDLLNNMATDKVDYTNFFRLLSSIKADTSIPNSELLVPLKAVLPEINQERKEAWTSWVKTYLEEAWFFVILFTLVSFYNIQVVDDRFGSLITSAYWFLMASRTKGRKAAMDSVNPKYVLRNHLCQRAIDAAEQGDYSEVRRLLELVEKPYDEQPRMEKYAELPPEVVFQARCVHAVMLFSRTCI
ncbi:hypothetical protein GW17_00059079 [Ensete ventricosum]|nr:hypothetical protein GW17_00059079 [Ensete ventricosum]